MPLDVNDYKEITIMIGRVEAKLDALRRDFVATDVQKIVNEKVEEKFVDLRQRIDKMESAGDKWIMRSLLAAAFIFSFLQFLVSIKVLP